MLYDDNVAQMELEEICSDIQIVPVKSSQPMKGISNCLSFGGFDFFLSTDGRTIYCMKGDSVISILDKGGRGRGEYAEIRTFAYSPEDSLLYVAGPHGLIIYKGLSHEVVSVIGNLPAISSIRIIEENKLLAACYIPDNAMEERNGFFIIDTKTGAITDPILTMNDLSKMFHTDSDFYQSDDSIYIAVGDRAINSIYLYSKGKLIRTLKFKYSKKLQIPKRVLVDDPDNINEHLIFNEYVRNNNFCIGAALPVIKNQGEYYMFWNSPEADDYILNIIKKDRVKRLHIKIPGIVGFVEPYWVSNDCYVTLFQNMFRETKAESNGEGLSNLAETIFREYDNNNDNPVIMKYRIK